MPSTTPRPAQTASPPDGLLATNIRYRDLLRERQNRLAREDFLAYVLRTTPGYRVNWHHREICDALMDVAAGRLQFLEIRMPPRYGKSELVSRRFPAWYLGRNPTHDVIAGSYGGELVSGFGRELRNLMNGERHLQIFPECALAADSQAKNRWQTTQGGTYIGAGVGGAITGFGMNLGIIDDPVKSREDAHSERMQEINWLWLLSDLLSRRMPPWAIVLVNTRWHELDMAGRIWDSNLPQQIVGDKYRLIHYPAIDDDGEVLWPDQFPKKEVEATRDLLLETDPYTWHALYQGTPTPDEGTFFKRDWFWTYETPPPITQMKIYGASDYATKEGEGDFTVHAVIGVDPEGVIWVLDLWREQATTDVWVEALVGSDDDPVGLWQRWKPQLWIEESGQIEKSVGPFLSQLQRKRGAYVNRTQMTSATDKPTRARSWQAVMATPGAVRWPKGAPWYSTLRAEFLAFPNAANDDMVDTFSLLGRFLHGMREGERPKKSDIPAILPPIEGGQQHPEAYRGMTYDDLWKEEERLRKRRRRR